jgi:hypothetical protein
MVRISAREKGSSMMSLEENITKFVNLYTGWLRECVEINYSVETTSDNGPYPYQWKIKSADSSRFLGYIVFHGPEINGSDVEKKNIYAHCCAM